MIQLPNLTKRQKLVVYPLAGLVGLYVLFLVVGNLFIKTGSLRSILNRHPEKLFIDYDTATMLWPGRLHVTQISVRGRDGNIEWIVLLDDADVSVGLFDLAKKRFHAERVRGDGVSFRFRQRLDKAEAIPSFTDGLPPIAGFADPPLQNVPVIPPATDPDAVWSVSLENVEATNVREVWLDRYRYAGHSQVQGGFSLHPLREVTVGPAHADVLDGDVFLAKDVITSNVKGIVDCTMRAFDPKAKSAVIVQSLTASAQLDGKFESAHFINKYTHDDPHFDHGKGPLHSNVRVRDGAFENGSLVRAQIKGLTVASGEYDATVDAALAIDVLLAKSGKSEGHAKLEGSTSIARKGFETSPIRSPAGVAEAHVADLAIADALKGVTYVFDTGKTEIPDVRVFTSYIDPKSEFQLNAGKGHVVAHAQLTPETKVAEGHAALDVEGLGFRLQKTQGRAGTSALRVKLAAKDYEKALDFSGSSLDLKDVDIQEEGPHPLWWGHVDLGDTRVGLTGGPTFHSVMTSRFRDGRPVLAVLRAEVPVWVRGLTSLEGLVATTVIDVAPSDARLTAIHAVGGGYDFAGTFRVKNGLDHGVFLIQKSFLSLGIEVKNGRTSLEPLFASAWYQERLRGSAQLH
jgi:hypothetical protein